MTNRRLLLPCLLLLASLISACNKQEEPASAIYESTAVTTRDIDITVEAAGIIEPETTIEVKSKASGEILAMNAETGDHVEQGVLLVQIDKRSPVNIVDQSRADLEAAKARRKIATTQLNRTKNLLDKGIVTETEYETAELELANAEAAVISRQVELENAQIALEDTDVKAPISGIVIEKNVERGQVISSPTRDVGGGTVLLKMADLATVQVRTRVDETDIGKIEPGMQAIVKVSAYPNQPFAGQVLKIEPQATVDQNVTMFPVLIQLENPKGLLRPGMNAEVKINIAHAGNVLAVPTMALRTDRDLATTATVMQLSTDELRQKIASSRASVLMTGQGPEPDSANTGRNNTGENSSPPGITGRNRDSRFEDNDSAEMPRSRSSIEFQYGGEYWVLLVQDNVLVPRFVQTGITDLEYSEVVRGLTKDEQVLILPSSGLLERQERIQSSLNQRMRPPGM
jgi:HlyD family secretion protein